MPADTLLNNRYRVKRPLAEDGLGTLHLTTGLICNRLAVRNQLVTGLEHLMLPPVFDDDMENTGRHPLTQSYEAATC